MLRISILCCLLLQPFFSNAQVPVLGAAAPFVIFSSTGAVGNTGPSSKFTGNIGTLSGAITVGVNVNGIFHNADATAIAATSSVSNAYNQLELTPPTDTTLSLTTFTLGNQDTLHAIVDSINNSVTLNDTLVLDGQNNANAVFIFKINGTFSTTSQAAIILINGALACNVFWEIKGALSTAANSQLRGTFIVNNSAVNLLAGTLLEGRILTNTTGAINMTSVLTYLPTGCGSTVLTGPAAPPMGTVACYALFTSDGANLNSGTTYLSGDVGTNVGLTTGYNPLLVTGTIHSSPDLNTSAAVNDLLIAYTALNVLPNDIELLYPVLLGNNLVLTPHTYILNAAATLTDTLYLNAEGNPNATFVIKIQGALTMSTYATVILLNGAQAKNVYWKVEGAITMNNYSSLKGTFISNNGALNLYIGVHLDGRALSTTGALSATSDSVTIPFQSCALVALPINWLSLNCTADISTVSVKWNVSRQSDGGMFSVEKSNDASHFEKMMNVPVRNEPTLSEHSYQVTDYTPFNHSYYRVTYTDVSGNRTVSKTISTTSETRTFNTISSNGTDFFITLNNNNSGHGVLDVYDLQGKKISSQSIEFASDIKTYSIQRPQQAGMYLVYITTGNKKRFVSKMPVM